MAPKRTRTKPKSLKTEPSPTEVSTTSVPIRDQASIEGCSTMQSEPFHSDVATDAAVIHPVTPEILDEVAHKAAQMADEVAHHPDHHAVAHATPVQDTPVQETSVQETAAQETPVQELASEDAPAQQDIAEPAGTPASGAADSAGTLVEGVAEMAQDARHGADQAMTEAVEATGTAVEQSGAALAEAVDKAARLASNAEERLSGSGDAIGRYNAAVFGMIRTNMAATGAFFTALVQAQSVPEAVAINADHLRRQFDTLTTQGRELAQLAQALAFDTLKLPAGTARRDG